MSVRISLDVSAGTFSRIEAICRDEFQNKAQYLRMLVDKNIAKRAGESDEKS